MNECAEAMGSGIDRDYYMRSNAYVLLICCHVRHVIASRGRARQ